jgi:hypothetical protein
MFTRALLAATLLGLLACVRPAAADDPPKKATTSSQVVDALRAPVQFEGDVNDNSLEAILLKLSETSGVRFVIRDDLFRENGLGNVRDSKPNVQAARLDGATLRRFLTVVLSNLDAAYLVRKDHVEVVPTPAAVEEVFGSAEPTVGPARVHPLVSEVYKDRPLDEVVADLAEEYDLTVVVAQPVGERRTAPVSVRLFNVPADRALEMIAVQADLRVGRRGNVYLITTPEHAKALAEEEYLRNWRQLELNRPRLQLGAPASPFGPGGGG